MTLSPAPTLGYRGAFLLLAATAWFLTGLQVATSPAGITGDLIHQQLPLWVSVASWWVPAAAAVVCAFLRVDWPAFALLCVAPLIRAFSYSWAWVTYVGSGGAEGLERGWAFAPGSMVMVGVVILIARWPDPPEVPDLNEGEQ